MAKPTTMTLEENIAAIIQHQNMMLMELNELRRDLNQIKNEMRANIESQIIKEIGDKIDLINQTLTETIVQKEILIENGLMTRDEINSKYAELRQRQ